MSESTKGLIGTITCFAIIGATIVSWAYVAYNPKVCPAIVAVQDTQS